MIPYVFRKPRMSRLAHKAWQTCVGVNSEKYLGIEVTGVYILRMHSRLIACIVGCLFAISTVVCANAIFNDDAALANTLANVPPSGSKPVTIPNDVAVGMLIYKVDPEYPAKAKAARISGIVILRQERFRTFTLNAARRFCRSLRSRPSESGSIALISCAANPSRCKQQ